MNIFKVVFSVLFIVFLSSVSTFVHADEWAVLHGVSYHFDREREHNEVNWGLGWEKELNKDVSALLGFYKNSFYRETVYVGANWTPLHMGPFKTGAAVVIATGYNEHPTAILIPNITYEGEKWGINLIVTPAALAASIKWRFY